ncbi:MAG: MFS transporter [Archaeoglobus sp.]|nr:MFS transporter [Archaeoglobus sp.]
MKNRIFNVLFISVFTAMLGLGIVSPLMPIYAESLGATGIWLGIIFAGFSISRGIFMPVIGRISDRKGRKKFILSGLFLYTIISIAYIQAASVYTLTFIRIIHGFASAMVIPIAMAYVGEISPEGEEGKYMGTFTVSLFLGMGFGPFIGGVLEDSFGMATAFYAMASLSALSLSICFLFLPEIDRFKARHKPRASFREILRNRVFKAVMLFRGINAFGRATLLSFLPVFASKMLTSSQIGAILATNILLTAFLQRPFGILADRYNRLLMIVLGMALASLSLILIPLLNTFPQFFLVAVILGLGGGLAMPAASAIVVTAGRNAGQGSTMGIFNTAMSMGMIAAPLVSGVIMDVFGISKVFYFAGLISFVGMLLFSMIADWS